MKKIVKGKLKKTILAILICIMCITVFPMPVNAKDVGSRIGGALFLPISQFLCKVGDVVIETLQKIFIGEEEGISAEALLATITLDDAVEIVRSSTSSTDLREKMYDAGAEYGNYCFVCETGDSVNPRYLGIYRGRCSDRKMVGKKSRRIKWDMARDNGFS